MNISLDYLVTHDEGFDQTWRENRYLNGNQTYTDAYIANNGVCQPNDIAGSELSQSYQWGFSIIQLLIMTVLLWLWSLGTYLMWLKAHKVAALRNSSRVARKFRSAFELATALQKDLKEWDEDAAELSAEQMEERIVQLNGGHLSYHSYKPHLTYDLGRHLWPVLKRNWMWGAACGVQLIFVITGSILARSFEGAQTVILFFTLMLLALFVALVLGRNDRARMFITTVSATFLILAIYLPLAMQGLLNTKTVSMSD